MHRHATKGTTIVQTDGHVPQTYNTSHFSLMYCRVRDVWIFKSPTPAQDNSAADNERCQRSDGKVRDRRLKAILYGMV
ncbi:hypothetical protein EVAR_55422_1 [Eumeta japonica]|uniref:Uncharacterized protein n=1 Tax=Eumeta variegata TaxID=151549 RepID=A0A4C1Z2A2_EUMVA|nr:hypothetical protein EVAR_55422_1 [Eumeta japonica]